MQLTIDIPPAVEGSLRQQFGNDLAQSAKQALAIAWYQAELLSIGQVAEFLGISIYDVEGLMKQHHVDAPYSLDDFEHDRNALKRVLGS
jgi:predicted HTH domain antitoxin